MTTQANNIDALHAQIRACRKCIVDGFPAQPPPIAGGWAPAPFMVIGQAPSLSDQRAAKLYQGPAGRKLIGWLLEAGFTEDDMETTVFLTALTLCFPGRVAGKSTDRAPSRRELANCRGWLDKQIALVRPRVIILFGKMAIDAFLPKMSLDEAVGQSFERDGRVYVPLPHSSGASTWLNKEPHRILLKAAIDRVGQLRRDVLHIASD